MRGTIAVAILVVGLQAGGCAAPSTAPLPTWTIAVEQRIPSAADGAPVAAWDLARDSEGRLYALQTRAQQVTVYDTVGRLLRTIGRPGAGPGEFRVPVRLAVGPGDSLWVSDDGTGRWSVFDSAGRPARQMPRRIARNCRPACGWFDQAGHLVDGALTAAAPSVFDNLIDFPQDGELPAVTLALPVSRDRNPSAVLRPLRPYEPRGLFAFDPEGFVWFGFSDRYHLAKLDRRGDTVALVDRSAESRPLSNAACDPAPKTDSPPTSTSLGVTAAPWQPR